MSTIAAQRPTARQAESLWRTGGAGDRVRATAWCSPTPRWSTTSRQGRYASFPSLRLDDLASAGLIALLEAVDRFDPAKGATFEQYTWTRVAGAIVDDLLRQDWASRSVRRLARQVDRARDDFYVKTGHFPTHEELAAKLELSYRGLARALRGARPRRASPRSTRRPAAPTRASSRSATRSRHRSASTSPSARRPGASVPR